jgi:NADH-quinone oxidoreductase subunit C/D
MAEQLTDDQVLEQEARRHVSVTTFDKLIDMLDKVVNWGRRSSLWPLQFGLACCAIEMICTAASRFDIARFGAELFRATPRQADLMIVSGTVVKRMVPMIVRLYNQMPEPKYVLSMGACSTGGGPFKEGYNVVSGIDEFLPVDVYVPGCPPTPQALLDGLIALQKKIDGESIRDARWYSKDGLAEAAVPLLGPDLVDPRQMDEIRDACQNPEKYERTFKDLPKRHPSSILEPKPAAPAAAAAAATPAEPPAPAPPTQTEENASRLNTALGLDGALQAQRENLLVQASNSLELFRYLKEAEGYDYLANLTSTDYADCYELVYHLASSTKVGKLLGVKIRTGKEDPHVPSLTSIWPGANFQEREVWDMMGIRFDGHPNLKRILLWEGFEGFPLRKDYLEPYYEESGKIFSSRWREGHHQRAEERVPFHRNVIYPKGWDPDQWTPTGDDLGTPIGAVTAERLAPDQLLINMGPQHPSTHGVFRMKLLVEGERITGLEPVMGYLHRNHEKIGERNTYLMNMPFTDRLDYICSMGNNFGYSLAVEKLMGIKPPERAEYIRVIMAELTRIVNHFWAIGFLLNDLGAFFTPALYAIEERELILDLFEMASGSRMMCNYFRFGGVAEDLPDEFIPLAKKLVYDRIPRAIDELDRYLTTNEILINRCRGVGVLKGADAIAYSAAGPVLRAGGVKYDVRRNDPYSIYDRFDFNVVVYEHGDIYDRYMVRIDEMRESTKILKQAFDQLPGGEIFTGKKGWQIRVPAGEAYGRVENPKGELGFYVVSDGEAHPYRYHVRAPSFINLTGLEHMCKGHLVADVVAILGSIDIVLGETDR